MLFFLCMDYVGGVNMSLRTANNRTRCYRDTVPASGECSPAHSPHRTHRDSVRCIVRCTSGSFFNLELRPTFTQPSVDTS